MNYEELLETRDRRQTAKVRLPYGFFHKRLIDGKYSNFVEFHDELCDAITFNDCVQRDCQATAKLGSKYQLRFTPNEGEDGVYALAVEPGNYLTFEQLLNEEPSMVARSSFINDTIRTLVEITTQLNEQGIQYVCFAPGNVFVRKRGTDPMLLCHGSFYQRLGLQEVLYEGFEHYVAPEVMAGGESTDRSDVFSLARFVDYLYASSGLPFELKGVLQKATAEDPAERYANVQEFYKALTTRHALRRTATLSAVAIGVALAAMWLFLDLLPSPDPVEFVKPVEEPISEEMLEEGFNPLTELGPDADSATIAKALQDFQHDSTRIDEQKIREFEAKGEAIFRKQFTKEADRILSKIYNNQRMSNDQKNFRAASDDVMKELVAKQRELASHSSLSDEKSQRIASEIIDRISEKKKAELEKKPNYQFQNGQNEKKE